jgi:mRNA interferase MazF
MIPRTMSGIMFKPGDIVVVPYPFSDPTRTKRRLVLVITAPDSQGDFIGLAITSKGYHVDSVALAQHDMYTGKLSSCINIETVATIQSFVGG